MQIEMTIKGLMVDPITNMPIIILRDKEGQKVLPIWVGIFEANAIALQIENVATPRPMTHDLLVSSGFVPHLEGRTPMRRIGQLSDLVGPIVFLASDASRYITGQTIRVDGADFTVVGVMPAGFEPGKIYELVYTSQDPPIVGLGPAAVRDLISRAFKAED